MVRFDMAGDNRKKVPVVFYRSEIGNEPVREWLLERTKEDRKAIGADIQTVEFGWPIGMPVCRPMGDGLYEVRTNLVDKQIARVLFCFHGGMMVLLHGIIKKSQKIPKSALDLAKRRKSEVEMAEKNGYLGSSLEDLLEETGELAEVSAVAIKRVVAWEISQKMKTEHISKTQMAVLMGTSRSALDRLLDPKNTSVTLHSLDNAARAVGKTLRLELI